MLTRHVTAADEGWALAAGADGVLHKSHDDEALLRELLRLDAMDAADQAGAPSGAGGP